MTVTPADVLNTLIEAEVGGAMVLANARSVRGARAIRSERAVDEVLVVVSLDVGGYRLECTGRR